MRFILLLLFPMFVYSSDLIQMPGGSLRSGDIEVSPIYPESNPLNLVYIHSYNPLHNCVVGMKVPHIETPFSVEGVAEFFVLINRPIKGPEPLLLRPHYWVSKDTQGLINTNLKASVISSENVTLLQGEHNVNAHDLVCSPSNMEITLDMAPDKSHLLYSMVETSSGAKAVTCHWIPNEADWESIWASEFLVTPSSDTRTLSDRMSHMFPSDPYWEIVRRIFE